MWDFFGNYVQFEDNEDSDRGYYNNFVMMKAVRKWIFRFKESYRTEEEDFITPSVPPIVRERFERFQCVKVLY
jgi:hypothetical protein